MFRADEGNVPNLLFWIADVPSTSDEWEMMMGGGGEGGGGVEVV